MNFNGYPGCYINDFTHLQTMKIIGFAKEFMNEKVNEKDYIQNMKNLFLQRIEERWGRYTFDAPRINYNHRNDR